MLVMELAVRPCVGTAGSTAGLSDAYWLTAALAIIGIFVALAINEKKLQAPPE